MLQFRSLTALALSAFILLARAAPTPISDVSASTPGTRVTLMHARGNGADAPAAGQHPAPNPVSYAEQLEANYKAIAQTNGQLTAYTIGRSTSKDGAMQHTAAYHLASAFHNLGGYIHGDGEEWPTSEAQLRAKIAPFLDAQKDVQSRREASATSALKAAQGPQAQAQGKLDVRQDDLVQAIIDYKREEANAHAQSPQGPVDPGHVAQTAQVDAALEAAAASVEEAHAHEEASAAVKAVLAKAAAAVKDAQAASAVLKAQTPVDKAALALSVASTKFADAQAAFDKASSRVAAAERQLELLGKSKAWLEKDIEGLATGNIAALL